MKLAIIITSDPKAGEEAFGRTFNALALAADARRHGDDVEVVFAGTGTRWPAELGNPAHGLYESVRPSIAGASCACASVFGATEGVRSCEVPELTENALPGTPGLASVRGYLADGWQTVVF
jgi:hypothetical protein